MIKGRIHSIETFGTVDGPGIRYILFMQGCQLKCRYCHNRDTWDVNSGREITPKEVIDDVMRYKSFYDASGGGLTISGGEATIQSDFVKEVFKLAKEKNIHTCLDTSGFVDLEKIEKILEYTDLVLLDIKHMVMEKSIWLTGASSEKAIALAKHLNNLKIPVWIRHVLVPSITDSEENLVKMAKFLLTLDNIERFEFLPYHTMGIHKWEEMDVQYTLSDIRPANNDDIERAKSIFIKEGFDKFN